MSYHIHDTLEKTGRTLAEKFGIQVVCHGLECCTDGNTIYLPGLPAELPDNLWQAMRGYLDHEVAHVCANSDFAGAGKFIEQHGAQAFQLLNALEDIRVETVLCEKYPGSAVNLQHGYDYALGNAPPNPDLLWQIGTSLYAIGRNRDYSMMSPEARMFAERFTAEAIAARTAPDTHTIEKLALRIWGELSQFLQSSDPSQPGNQSGADTQAGGLGGHGNAKGTQNGKRAEKTSDNSSVSTPQATNASPSANHAERAQDPAPAQTGNHNHGNSTAHASAPSTDPASGNSTAQAGAQDMHINIQDLMARSGAIGNLGAVISAQVNQAVSRTHAYRPYSTKMDKVIQSPAGNSGFAHDLMLKARSVCAGISQKLLLSLQAERNARWLGDQERGSINPAALHRLSSSAQPRIFRTRIHAEALNTAVTLLIDQSRSMKGERIHLAMITALAFTEALERLNIPVAVEGFSTQEMTPELHTRRYDLEQKAPELMKGLRMIPLLHTRFKRFDESLRQALPRFSSESVYELTPLGEALHHAARGILERKDRRKILFCLTDGRPVAGIGDEAITFAHAKDMIGRIEKAGVEVVLIGIKEPAVQQLHDKHVVVNALPELPREVMRTLGKILREGKQERVRSE